MGSLKYLAIALLLSAPALAQTAKFGVGRATTPEELRKLDISIGPTGEELPPGRGTPAEGEKLFTQKGCIGCHGKEGVGGLAPALRSKSVQGDGGAPREGLFERVLPLDSPYPTTVWDFIHRAMPLGNEGSLAPDEVYSLTAYLFFLNKVIPENAVLDKASLPNVKMPHAGDYAKLPDWKPGTPRLKDYPF